MSNNILEIKDLNVSYGGIKAVKDISFVVPKGEVVTLIGANGAGKSSTLRSIVGLVKPESGSIQFNGQELSGMPTDQIVAKGITLVPEGRRVFPDMTVLENLKIGAYMRKDSLEEDLKWVHDLFPRLKERSWQLAGTLSGGEQQMLAIGRALMSKPDLIMMDEPSLGLAPLIVKGVFDIIREINQQGVTILLVEQNANMALQAANLGYVMETGRITLTGTGAELLENGLRDVLQANGLKPEQVRMLASIDLKKEEPALLALSGKYQIPFVTYSADELRRIPLVSAGSDFVKRVTGVDNVCERAAVLSCENGELIQKKCVREAMTAALVGCPVVIRF